MEDNSYKRDLIKKDIFEAITDEPPNDLNNIFLKLKRAIEEIEGDLNNEANEILRQLSEVLSSKKEESESKSISPTVSLIRQDTFIISKDKCEMVGDCPEISCEKPPEKSLYGKITEALQKNDIQSKVIVVLVEPQITVTPYQCPTIHPLKASPSNKKLKTPNPKINRRRSLSPDNSVRSCPISKIPTPKSKFSGSVRNLNTLNKSRLGSEVKTNRRPITQATTAAIYGGKSLFGRALQRK